MNLQNPISSLPMVGPSYAKRLNKLNIHTIQDLLLHLPHRHEDLRQICTISTLKSNIATTLIAEVISCQNIYTKTGKKIQKAILADKTGQIEATWFNQPYITTNLKPGIKAAFAGKLGSFGFKPTLISPEYEVIKHTKSLNSQIPARLAGGSSSNLIHTGRLVPIYPETRGLSSKWLRSRIFPLLKNLKSPHYLPQSIKTKYSLINWLDAVKSIHFPSKLNQIPAAKSRLAFDELLFLHLTTLTRKLNWQKQKTTHSFHINQNKILKLIASLPFKLTRAQNQAIKQILSDLEKNTPMNRLLEGDVGSGKTVVAATAIYACFLNGFQSALMAPTQILAHQHEQTLRQLLEPLGIKISLITSGYKSKTLSASLRAGKKQKLKNNVLIGTHALLHHPKLFNKLGLVVIDEQHRFGVEQRAKLIQNPSSKVSPHLLTMTATPIPRTISLTLYGNLALSLLDEMPQNRKPTKTWVVPPEKRASAYQWIKNQIRLRRTQAFIVCPLIEESDKESMAQVKAATAEFNRLKNDIFPDLKLALLHGKVKAKDKQKIISQFSQGKTHILVSTPVVEVGIDIPSASIMLIEAADRFGLSQLHQLRGRVGRRGQQGYCLLFSQTKSTQSLKRLKALETETSGLRLAEIDLKLRGPGELYGTRQHGFADLKIASFTDAKLIAQTRQVAENLINKNPSLSQHPSLKQQVALNLKKIIEPN